MMKVDPETAPDGSISGAGTTEGMCGNGSFRDVGRSGCENVIQGVDRQKMGDNQ